MNRTANGTITLILTLFLLASASAVENDLAVLRKEARAGQALERVKRQVSACQFQLFDLHTLQGLSIRDTANATGSRMAAVYMAKSRVGRLMRRESERLREQDFRE